MGGRPSRREWCLRVSWALLETGVAVAPVLGVDALFPMVTSSGPFFVAGQVLVLVLVLSGKKLMR